MSYRILFLMAISMALPRTHMAAEPPRPLVIEPLLRSHCLDCHSTAKQKGDLDLESSAIRSQPQIWENVLEQIALGEMPPKKERQFDPTEKATFVKAIQNSLDAFSLENAGDPGPVLLRRLSNREYTYSIQDLTGIPTLDPAREFPEDGAAGEGFTNTGAALVMSPALLTKYFDAAKEIAKHMVLTPKGIRFSDSTSPQDWTNEALGRIRKIYDRYSSGAKGSETVQQGIKLDIGDGSGRIPLQSYLRALQSDRHEADLSPKYLTILKAALTANDNDPLLAPLRTKFRDAKLSAEDIAPWQNILWRFT